MSGDSPTRKARAAPYLVNAIILAIVNDYRMHLVNTISLTIINNYAWYLPNDAALLAA